MVEGARLESVCAGNRTEGSNPSLSAIISKPRLVRGLLIMMRGVGFEP